MRSWYAHAVASRPDPLTVGHFSHLTYTHVLCGVFVLVCQRSVSVATGDESGLFIHRSYGGAGSPFDANSLCDLQAVRAVLIAVCRFPVDVIDRVILPYGDHQTRVVWLVYSFEAAERAAAACTDGEGPIHDRSLGLPCDGSMALFCPYLAKVVGSIAPGVVISRTNAFMTVSPDFRFLAARHTTPHPWICVYDLWCRIPPQSVEKRVVAATNNNNDENLSLEV